MKKIFFSLLFLLVCSPVYAFDISSLGTINSSVIDRVGVLKPEQKSILESKIADLRTKYTVEILTIVIPSMDGEDISSTATEIGQKIGVWKADKDNGLVLLIAINDRAWDIATGYGLEGVLPDLLAKRIGEKNFILFRNGQYYEWILGSFDDFDKALSGDTSILSTQWENKGTSSEWFFILQFIVALLISSIFFRPLTKIKQYKKLFLYLLIAYIITLPLAYFAVQNIFFLLENIGIWIFWSLIGIFAKPGNWWNFWSWGSSSGWWGFGGFGWGWFGWGWSSGKW